MHFTKLPLSSQQKTSLLLQFLPFEADSALNPLPFSSSPCSEVYEFAAHLGQCDGKLRSIGIGTGEVIENGRGFRAESASKGRNCRRSDVFC